MPARPKKSSAVAESPVTTLGPADYLKKILTARVYDVAVESPLEVGRVAEKITAALSQPFVLSMATVQIGCSIGQALFPDDGSDAEQLIRIADERMYQQKQQRHQGR